MDTEDRKEEGVRISLQHLATPARNTLEVDEEEEQLDFLFGLDKKNRTWLDFASWSSGYQKQIQKILEPGETDSVESGCSLPMDEGSCVSKSSPEPIFSWFPQS